MPDPSAVAHDPIINTLLLTTGAALLAFLGKLGDLYLKYKEKKWLADDEAGKGNSDST